MFPDLTRDDVFRLETRRLWLRWPRVGDLDAIVRGAGDKCVADMTGVIPHPYGPHDAQAWMLKSRTANADGGGLTLAITPRSKPGSLVGAVGIAAEEGSTPVLGYWLAAEQWGHGFATEAARALIDAFFAYTPGQELTASVRVTNPTSRRVLEKCGFVAAGSGLKPFPARGVLPVDHFRLDRRKWRSLKAWSATDYVPLPASALDPEGPPPQLSAAIAASVMKAAQVRSAA